MAKKITFLLLLLLIFSCQKVLETNDVFLKFYGDAFEDIGYSVAKAENGYFIAAQFTEIQRNSFHYIDGSKKRFGIVRTGANGETLNKQMLGEVTGDTLSGVATKILVLDDGSAVCTGYVSSPEDNGNRDIIVGMLDSDGNITSQNIFAEEGNQYGIDILQTSEGFLILGATDVIREPLTDYTGNAAGKKDFLVLRIRNDLQLIGSDAKGFIGNDEPAALKNSIRGGYIAIGTTDRSEKPASEQALLNIMIIEINSDGKFLDPKIVGGTANEVAADFEVLSDGYLVIGTVGLEGSIQSGHVWKIPGYIQTAPLDEHAIDIEPFETTKTTFALKAISRYKTNSFIICGQYGTGLSARMLIFGTDADGNIVDGWLRIVGGTGSQIANDVISEGADIVAVGKNSFEKNSLISLFKFRF